MTAWSDKAVITVEVLLNGVWVDISTYVMTRGGVPVNWSEGRQSELGDDQPASGSMTLLNNDHRFTAGNTSSPYYPYWAQGRRVRVREAIGGQTFETINGYLEIPEDTRTEHANSDRVTVNLVDLLGRMQSMPTFVSTVAAHVAGSGNDALVGYWPLLDTAEPFTNIVGNSLPDSKVIVLTGSVNPLEVQPHVLPAEGEQLPGDDVPGLRMVPGVNGSGTAWSPTINVSNDDSTSFASLADGEILTLVLWVNLDLTYDDVISPLILTTTDGLVSLSRVATGSGGDLFLDYFGSLTGSVSTSVTVGSLRYYMVAVRFGINPHVLELWVDDQVYTATLTGSLSGPQGIFDIQVGPYILGSVAHLQLYIGSSTDWAYADFLAQREVGLNGLERQTTGQRVNTVLNYAGIDASLRDIDPGCSVMQRASLADQSPLDALQDANRTEQGRLFMRGDRVQFHDRRHVYNI